MVDSASSSLRRYLAEQANVDVYWYIGSRLHLAPISLPNLTSPLTGSSVVPYRYHFNTGMPKMLEISQLPLTMGFQSHLLLHGGFLDMG